MQPFSPSCHQGKATLELPSGRRRRRRWKETLFSKGEAHTWVVTKRRKRKWPPQHDARSHRSIIIEHVSRVRFRGPAHHHGLISYLDSTLMFFDYFSLSFLINSVRTCRNRSKADAMTRLAQTRPDRRKKPKMKTYRWRQTTERDATAKGRGSKVIRRA